jgi:hypothetical protein
MSSPAAACNCVDVFQRRWVNIRSAHAGDRLPKKSGSWADTWVRPQWQQLNMEYSVKPPLLGEVSFGAIIETVAARFITESRRKRSALTSCVNALR